jgi:hypothetical protein
VDPARPGNSRLTCGTSSWRAGCPANGHVRFGGRTGETERPRGRHRAPARPYFYLLEAAGFETWLVNAKDVKHLPGRPKTDRLDCIWLLRQL